MIRKVIFGGAQSALGRSATILKTLFQKWLNKGVLMMVVKVKFYKAKDGWRWRGRTPNGRLVMESGEAYTRRYDAKKAAYALSRMTLNYDIKE